MIVVINNSSTERDLKDFERAFSKLSSPERVKEAIIDYEFPIPAPFSNPLNFPLVLSTDDNIKFCVLNVTAGYSGEGPSGTCKILKMCGFRIDEKLIFKDSQGKRVRMIFTK